MLLIFILLITGTTIILSSSYTSEARRAYGIAFMYRGKCLRYGRPFQMFTHYECRTLEQVFYKLCKEFIANNKQSFKYVMEEEENKRIRIQDILSDRSDDDDDAPVKKNLDFDHIKAMAYQNRITMKCHLKTFILVLLLPVLQICLIDLCFGRPKGIPIGIYRIPK